MQSEDSSVENLSSTIQDNLADASSSSPTPPSDSSAEDSSSSSLVNTVSVDSVDSASTQSVAEPTNSAKETPRWDNAWTYTVGLGNNTYTSTIYSSPQVFWNGACWLNTTYEEHAGYRLMRNSRVTAEVYDYYAKYYDVNYSEVRLYDERFEVQRWLPKQQRWDDLGAQSGTPTYAVTTNTSGVWLTKSFTPWAGILSITHTLRVAQPLKTTITWKSLLTEETEFRIVMKWNGIAGDKVNTSQGTMNVTAPIAFNSTLYTFMKQDGTIAIQESLVDTGFYDESRVYRNYVLQPTVVDVGSQGMKCDYVFQNSTLYTISKNGIIVVDPTTSVYNAESDRTGYITAMGPSYPPGAPDYVSFSYICVGQYKYAQYDIYRGYVSFNTANLEDDVVILSSKIYLYKQYNHADTPFYLQVWGGTQGTEGLYGALDLYAWGEGESVVGSFYIDLNLGGYAEIPITDLNQINKVGKTQFELRTSREGTPPTAMEYVDFYSGTTSSLSITWKVPEITVTGQIRYYEQDGSTLRKCRQITVKLWEEDPEFPYWELLGTTQTDDNGVYSLGPFVNRDNGQVGQRLDLFIVIWADIPNIVYVHPTLWETYNKQSQTYWNVYGDMWFINYDISGTERGAWHITDVILNGYNFAKTYGHTHPGVAVEWPQSSSWCNEYTIGISDSLGNTWHEDVILHEYGHSVYYNLAGKMGELNAFNQGWADFFGVAANFENGHEKDTYHTCEVPACTGNLETYTQGTDRYAIRAALWDIYDVPDDPPDGIAKGIDEMFDVLDWHGSETIGAFWEGWINRGYGCKPELWNMFGGHGITHGDSVNPTVDMTQPLDGATVSGTIAITATAYDDFSGVWKVEFYVDGFFKLPYVKYFLNSTVSTVDPLPFHAMTTYPYPPNEHYPTDPIHQLYLRLWNTRYIGQEAGMENGGSNLQISVATNEKTSQLDEMLANMILADQKTAGNTVNIQI